MHDLPTTRSDGRVLTSALAVLALAAAVAYARYRPPAPLERAAPVQAFSAGRAADVLARVLGDGAPRPSGTSAHAHARAAIAAELDALGVVHEVQETLGIGPSGRIAVVRNVVARIPGRRELPASLLCAHYDSVGASPGAADDGAGVASLIEIARALLAGPPRDRPVILLFSDAAEPGSIGASAFVEQHRWARDVGAVVELEARGTRGPSLLAEISPGSGALVAALAPHWPRPLASSAVELVHKRLPSETDLAVFRERAIPGIGLCFTGGAASFHTDRDDWAHLDFASVQHQGEIALAAVRAFDGADLAARGERSFTDLFGLAIASWPATLDPPLAAAAVALAAAAVWRARIGARCVAKETLAALALAVAALALPVGAAWLAGWAWRALGGSEDPSRCAPLAAQAMLAATAFGCALAGGAVAAACQTRAATLMAVEVALAALAALAAAAFLPAAFAVVAIPALASGLLAAASGAPRCGVQRWRANVAPILLPVCASVAALPVVVALAHESGLRAPAVAALPWSAIGAALLPAAALSPRLALRGAVVSFAAAAVSSAILAAAPSSTPDAPAPLDLRYVLDLDRSAARVEASTFGAGLPPEIAAALPFERATTPPFPWLTLDRSLFAAPGPFWSVPGPRFEVVSDTDEGADRVVRARIRSARGATRLHLRLPRDVRLSAVTWNDHAIARGFARSDSHLFFAMDSAGVEIELRAPVREAFEVWLLDQDWTLPEEVARLARSRPADRCPRADGEVSIVGERIEIAAGAGK